MSGRGTEPFPSETRASTGLTLAQMRNLAEAAAKRFPDPDDYLAFLRPLLAPMRSNRSAIGRIERSPEWKAARQEWNARCRAWIEAQGRIPGEQIRKEDQRAYEAATGDVWALIEEGLS